MKEEAGYGTAISFRSQNQDATFLNEERGSSEMGFGILLVEDGSIKADSSESGSIEANRTYRHVSERNPCAF